jgi:PAS domain S-box-containing protein
MPEIPSLEMAPRLEVFGGSGYESVLAAAGAQPEELIVVMRKSDGSLAYLNEAAQMRLNPGRQADFSTLRFIDFVGLDSQEKVNGDMLLHAALFGKWKGGCTFRDVWGSEFRCDVQCFYHPANGGSEGSLYCLRVTLAAEPGDGQDASTMTDHDLLHALLETMPDAVYFKDKYSRFIRVNKALAHKCRCERPEDLLGRTDFDFQSSEHAQLAYTDEQKIIRTGEPLIGIEEKETWPDGRVTWVSTTKIALRNAGGVIVGTFGVSRDITVRKQAEERLLTLSRIVEQSPFSVVITDLQGTIEYVNPAFCAVTGYAAEEVVGKNPRILKSGETNPDVYRAMWVTLSRGVVWQGELSNRKKNGQIFIESVQIVPVVNGSGEPVHYVALKEDITERKKLDQERKELLVQLQLAQKLESIGRLAAGVAHEINTPTQFLSDNIRFLTDAFDKLAGVLRASLALREVAAGQAALHDQVRALIKAEETAELTYLLTEVPSALSQSQEGLGRVARIVQSLKEYSHPQNSLRNSADLNRVVATAITVSRHEWKYVAEVVTDFCPDLPTVPCVVDEFNQVILNLLVNAAHAIEAAQSQKGDPSGLGTITVRTRPDGDYALVEVIDTGTGIPREILPKIFEPFFTTKDIGKGTGQGLAIVHAVIVGKHGGKVDVTTEVGRGTTFHLRLPLISPQPPSPP